MQPDLYGDVPQPARAPAAPPARPLTAADVRAKMVALMEAARGADRWPWEGRERSQHLAMFPIMAQWLTPEDGAELVRQFEVEVARLRLAE